MIKPILILIAPEDALFILSFQGFFWLTLAKEYHIQRELCN
jgi:hypothetical protein